MQRQDRKCPWPPASFFFGVRIMLGTILGRFSIIYFRGLGLRIKVMVWVMVRVWVGVSVVLWSLTASVAEWLRAWDTLTMFEATVCRRS